MNAGMNEVEQYGEKVVKVTCISVYSREKFGANPQRLQSGSWS